MKMSYSCGYSPMSMTNNESTGYDDDCGLANSNSYIIGIDDDSSWEETPRKQTKKKSHYHHGLGLSGTTIESDTIIGLSQDFDKSTGLCTPSFGS